MKRDQRDLDWRLRLDDTPNVIAIGCTDIISFLGISEL